MGGARKNLSAAARRFGIEAQATRARDRLVAVLEGWPGDPLVRRNVADDRALRLLLRLTIPPDANCLDVGAHQGVFLGQMVRSAPAGRHIAYEPQAALAGRLRTRFPDVDVRDRVLSDTAGRAAFVVVDTPGRRGYSHLAGVEGNLGDAGPSVVSHEIEVSAERLDDARPSDWLPRFVKVDAEGAERRVFEGAAETLAASRPTIAFEHGWAAREDSGAIHDLLTREVGLRIFDLTGAGPFDRAEFSAGVDSTWNWLARP